MEIVFLNKMTGMAKNYAISKQGRIYKAFQNKERIKISWITLIG